MSEHTFTLSFKTAEPTYESKQIPLYVGGVQSGTITIRRNTTNGIMDITPYIPPVSPNISNTYFFEKTVTSVDQNKFVTLIDVYIDTLDYKLPDGVTLADYLAAGQPNNLSSSTYLDDLTRWKAQKSKEVLSRYKGTTLVSVLEFNSITSARMVPWTGTFTCAVVTPPPDPELPPPPPPAPPTSME